MKTAFVTGAGGWIGLELVESLLKDNYKVKALIRRDTDQILDLKEKFKQNLIIIKGDMISVDSWKSELKQVDYLFHLAAKVHSKPNNQAEINEFYTINRDCTNKLFDIALEENIKKIVFVSTVAVYGNHNNEIINKNTKRNPNTPYAISKNDAEKYGLELYKKHNFPITIIQPVTVYGGNDRGNFKKLYDLANKGVVVKFGSGQNKKTIIHYKNLVEIMKKISESEDVYGRTFICGTESISYNQISSKMKSSSKTKLILTIPDSISKLSIKILKILNINKLSNIASNIETLMNDNIYNYEDSIEYLNDKKIIKFESWNCRKEYGRYNLEEN
ncbi:NAD-dependent epimerase/dehydratase family protein [Paraclostridium bifermentans]|uniref:NAD-dependent epimerase/dehydratase family protein n=1 Tax=Paraclostridium bifermentans TaxID=1490 RepID=UPI00359C5419